MGNWMLTNLSKLSLHASKLNSFNHSGNKMFRLFPKKVDLQALMKYYDVDGDGSITYEEFLNGLRDELTQRRYLMVEKAWNIMDKDNSGKITVTDICI